MKTCRDSGIPPYLRDAHYKGAEKSGYGTKYLYPHSYGGFVKQQYLPDSHKDKIYYKPTSNGFESKIKDRLIRLWDQK